MSTIIAINAGSSSLKFQLLQMPEETIITKGVVERIGLETPFITVEVEGEKKTEYPSLQNHEEAVKALLNSLTKYDVITDVNDIEGVGHRVVHGGETFSDSVLITDQVLNELENVSELAPLHNPANIVGIKAFRDILPDVPSVAVFDTAFHQSIPKEKYLYGVPYEYYEKYGVRKYGFHGTSHKYVSQRMAELMDRPQNDLKIISCHIGNGASITAVDHGISVDTSMGFTPLAGVMMGTRSGNIDPALIPYLMEKTGQTAAEVIDTLNKKSGLLGVSGASSDLRDVVQQAEEGSERAQTALDVYLTRMHKYIGTYAASMDGVDAVIFTAGVGENSALVREKVMEGLEFMGIQINKEKNGQASGETFIQSDSSRVAVAVVPTDEEVMIARDTVRLGQIQ
ncbi:acetate kinase [Marinococcus halophilus]|uniref:Acetate kinase n=1 Tax=Marinococcus halophilus TaxID=1371 RepID=A0A510Y5Y9_MARHA|nr:acetate kinase [Marinococcus halophilus]OZT79942.1 acetate kinase [Marinococcus halophilus]GEK58141.1 acetate kinase [Marinococcus halophilus]